MTSTPSTTPAAGALGSRVTRVDAKEKIRGQAQYVGDIKMADLLHGKVLRADTPRGRILSIDTSEAERMPGVVCVLTGADLSDIDPYYGHAIKDRPIVALDRIRFAGEPVAAVAARTEAQAEAALRAIRVGVEEESPVLGVDAALAPDAALVHEEGMRAGAFHGLDLSERTGNVCYRFAWEKGDLDAAFADADIVVEGTYRFGSAYQYSMETHATIAHVQGDEINLWSNCQHPFLVRAELASVFGVPLSRVRIVVPFLGGGFGAKSYTRMEPIAVALARKAGLPVRIVNTVDESILTSRQHAMTATMRTAARADGTLLARDVVCWFDTGAYADNGPRVAATGGDSAPGPYAWEAVKVIADCVYTNTAPAGSYRAFGAVHLTWIGEIQVDQVARRVGLDPLEIRRRNLLPPGGEMRPGGKPVDADLVGDIEKVAAALGTWGAPRDDPWVGRGLAVGVLAAGAHPVSSATIRMEADGNCVLLSGTTEVGQGARTVFAQIAAEVLGIPPERIRMQGTDTRFTPYDRSTGASRSTTVAGLAVKRAADDLLEQLRAIKGGEPDPAEYGDLMVSHFGFRGGELVGHGEVTPEGSGSYAEGPHFWEICVGAAEVRVDPETGMVDVLRTATVADVGRAINPLFIERQDEGATLQGIGTALFEELDFSTGILATDTLLDYRIPTTHDVPAQMTPVIVENEDGPGPFGAKGMGEGGLAAVASSVAVAVADTGLAVDELPLTPERVWRLIQQQKNAREGEPDG